jgi:hypothetical protein
MTRLLVNRPTGPLPRAERTARTGRRTCKSAAHLDHCPERGASTVRELAGTLRTLARSRSPGLPLSLALRATAAPARVGPEVTANMDAARDIARGTILPHSARLTLD